MNEDKAVYEEYLNLWPKQMVDKLTEFKFGRGEIINACTTCTHIRNHHKAKLEGPNAEAGEERVLVGKLPPHSK